MNSFGLKYLFGKYYWLPAKPAGLPDRLSTGIWCPEGDGAALLNYKFRTP